MCCPLLPTRGCSLCWNEKNEERLQEIDPALPSLALTQLKAVVDAKFADIDVILTAPAPGEAPLGLQRTGNATFNLLWTYLWMPCVALPFTKGPTGLPVGIQLVGRQHDDAALLDIAAWVKGALS